MLSGGETMSDFFSLSTRSRYAGSLRAAYEKADAWPADAKEVDVAMSERLYEAVIAGHDIKWEAATGFTITPAAPKPLADIKADALRTVDGLADHMRRELLGDSLRSIEYDLTAAEARAYMTAGYTGEVPPTVQSWADAAGLSPRDATDSILARADRWRRVVYDIRHTRLRAKEAVRDAADRNVVETVVGQLKTDLKILADQYADG